LQLNHWDLIHEGNKAVKLRKQFVTRNFLKALEVCCQVGKIADAEGHHPNLHLTDYNCLTIELTTHARGGLSENDFILAAKVQVWLFSVQPPLSEL
jgi:4a-hydroxytetrahydrobiopterin dehydratase